MIKKNDANQTLDVKATSANNSLNSPIKSGKCDASQLPSKQEEPLATFAPTTTETSYSALPSVTSSKPLPKHNVDNLSTPIIGKTSHPALPSVTSSRPPPKHNIDNLSAQLENIGEVNKTTAAVAIADLKDKNIFK
ncbi:hypothetical protein HK100_009353, partial [Physocladia obscura]